MLQTVPTSISKGGRNTSKAVVKLSKAKVEFELEEFKNQVVVGYDIDSNLFVFESPILFY
jgi:hypothetical protein